MWCTEVALPKQILCTAGVMWGPCHAGTVSAGGGKDEYQQDPQPEFQISDGCIADTSVAETEQVDDADRMSVAAS